jgi:farnesyl-diphosphate farnesyltransferase
MALDLSRLLERTSRTFALSIPLLPEPLCREITVAYLLFRVADTLEDAARWDRRARLRALGELAELLAGDGDVAGRAAAWREKPPCDHEGYLELLAALPGLFEELAALRPGAREVVRHHALRTAVGMARFAERGGRDGSVVLGTLEELRAYCYVVAGIVGELLTDLFLLDPALASAEPALRLHARAFGEGLQLVNIVKDARDDERERRRFLPRGVPSERIFALARADLDAARLYVGALQAAGAGRGIVAFCALPVRLAIATLSLVEREGPGAKVPRAEVAAIVGALEQALERGDSAV